MQNSWLPGMLSNRLLGASQLIRAGKHAKAAHRNRDAQATAPRAFTTLPAWQACIKPDAGFWRHGLPPPEVMQNGRFAGKGRSWVFAQTMEEFTTAREAKEEPDPQQHWRTFWERAHERASESSEQSGTWTSKAGGQSWTWAHGKEPFGSSCSWGSRRAGYMGERAYYGWHGQGQTWGHGSRGRQREWAHQWRKKFQHLKDKHDAYHRMNGPIHPDYTAFNVHPVANGPLFQAWRMRARRWRQYYQSGHLRPTWRNHRHGWQARFHAHHARWHRAHSRGRMPRRETAGRFKNGLLYFLTTRGPRCQPDYRSGLLLTHQCHHSCPIEEPVQHELSERSKCFQQVFGEPFSKRLVSRRVSKAPAEARRRDVPRFVQQPFSPPPMPAKTASPPRKPWCRPRRPRPFSKPPDPAPPPGVLSAGEYHCIVQKGGVQLLESGLALLYPVAALLKSASTLGVVTTISRVLLSVFPFSLRAKILHIIKLRYENDPNASGWIKAVLARGINSSFAMRANARFIFPALLVLPLAMIAATILSSMERTPVSGRVRVVMLNEQEERNLEDSVLAVGKTVVGMDWVRVLCEALNLPDEGVNRATGRRRFLGADVLPASDPRMQWASHVLQSLEAGVPQLGLKASTTDRAAGVASPPPSVYPLKDRTGDATSAVRADYQLLVVDRPESNAFSFGFCPKSPQAQHGSRGVVVVYSGFLQDILSQAQDASSPLAEQSATLFGSLSSTFRPSKATFAPTLEQSAYLAVLLSHELSHLVLSHTIESYASTNLLIPAVARLGADVLRTLVYPVTFFLGPFVGDSIGAALNAGAREGFGVLGQATSACESRNMEIEADLVGLRLLSYAGVDPAHALNFWSQRLVKDAATGQTEAHHHHYAHPQPSGPLRPHSAEHDANREGAFGFLRTHPVNAERVREIKLELARWDRLQPTLA